MQGVKLKACISITVKCKQKHLKDLKTHIIQLKKRTEENYTISANSISEQ